MPWQIVDYSRETVQVLLTDAYIPLHFGKGDQQSSQEILTSENTRAQTEMQTFKEVSDEWQKKEKKGNRYRHDYKVKFYFHFTRLKWEDSGCQWQNWCQSPPIMYHMQNQVWWLSFMGSVKCKRCAFSQPNYTEHIHRFEFKLEAVLDLLNEKKFLIVQPHLRQNELAVIFLHK